jgi:hypothetical protein
MVVRGFCVRIFACVCECVWVRTHWYWTCVASRLCRPSRGTAETGGIYSSAWTGGRKRVHFAFVASFVCPHGRRCDVDESCDQRSVGWPIWAHERDRRHRRHLRHRRLRLRRHLLQRRVGQHRRRCAAGLARGRSRGTRWLLGGVLAGYCPGTRGVLAEYLSAPYGYSVLEGGNSWVGTPVARRGPAVFIARPATRGRPHVRFVLAIGRFARVDRRCDVDEPYTPGGMGWTTLPHVRDRRRRGHLRHRRLLRL